MLSEAEPRRILLFGDSNVCQRQAELAGSEFGLRVPGRGERRGDGSWVAPAGPFPRSADGVRASSFPAHVDVAVVLVHDAGHQGLPEQDQDAILGALAEALGSEVVSVDASGPTDETFKNLLEALEVVFFTDGDGNSENDSASSSDKAGSNSEPKNRAKEQLTDTELFGPLLGPSDAPSAGHSASSLLASLASQERTAFGPLHLSRVMHFSLASRGFATPTPIQLAAAKALHSGESAILHAETGSGKTLSFLLPLLQALIDRDGGLGASPPCSLVLVSPTRELAAQTFREVQALLPGADRRDAGNHPLAHLLDGGRTDQRLAAVVVGTAKQLAQRLAPPQRGRDGDRELDARVGTLVLDEVDRLFALPGKYSTLQEQERRNRHPRPSLVLLDAAVRRNPKLQVVAVSATVGRHLRRELGRIIRPNDVKEGVPVLRPTADPPAELSVEAMTVAEARAALERRGVPVKAKVLKADLVAQLVALLREEHGQSPWSAPTGSRAVTVPSCIAHSYIPLREASLDAKVQALLVALTLQPPRSPLIFLPDGTSVEGVVQALQRGGFPQSMGLEDALTRRCSDLYTNALKSREKGLLDAAAPLKPLPLLVACESAARGLHLDGVDVVYVLARPKNADEYVHLAGRTGRCGVAGRVVSVVSYTEAAALHSWSTQLNFALDRVAGIDLE